MKNYFAQQLGRMARGKPKNQSVEQRAAAAARMSKMNKEGKAGRASWGKVKKGGQ